MALFKKNLMHEQHMKKISLFILNAQFKQMHG
jgi:hypothetical protein